MESISFTISKNDLSKALLVVAPAVSPKSTTPSLTFIYCQIIGENLHLTGCNSQIQVETSILVLTPSGDVSFLVDKSIIDTLKTLPEQPLDIKIEVDSHTLFIKHSTGEISVNISLSQYDKMKNGNAASSSFSIPASRLLNGLEKNSKQMAADDLRPVMCGIYIDIQNDSLTFVASDGHRLSRLIDKTIQNVEAESFILHRDAVPVLIKQLLSADDELGVNIQSNSNNVRFVIDSTIVTVRLIDGRYPNYNAVIPQSNDKTMLIDSKELQAILARLNTVSNSSSKLIKIEAKTEQTIFIAQDIDLNKGAVEKTPYTCTQEITIGAKGTFLHELIGNISGELIFSFSDFSKAMLIEPVAQEEGTLYTLLLMPMMLNE